MYRFSHGEFVPHTCSTSRMVENPMCEWSVAHRAILDILHLDHVDVYTEHKYKVNLRINKKKPRQILTYFEKSLL